MADNRTMAQMLQAPIEGYEDAIVVPPINANNFELSTFNQILCQSNKFTTVKPEDSKWLMFTSCWTSLCVNFQKFASTSNSGKTLQVKLKLTLRQQIHAITTRANPNKPVCRQGKWAKSKNGAHVPPPEEEESIFMEIPKPKAKKTVNVEIQDLNSPRPIPSKLPYPERMKVRENDKPSAQHSRFLKMFKQLRLEIGLKDALVEMPKFNKWLSSLLRNKEKLEEIAITTVNAECSAIIMNKVPEKLEDPGKFLIPCALQELDRTSALADSGASINLLPHSIYKKLGLEALTPTRMTLELANRSITHPMGIAEDVVVRVDGFTFLADFVVVNFEPDPRVPIILGRPFLRTAKALIDLYEETLTLRVGKEELVYYADKSEKNKDKNFVHAISVIDFLKADPFSGSTTNTLPPSSSPVKTSDNFKKFADELSPLDSLPPGTDDSTLKKDLHEENFQVYSNPLFEFDDNFKSSNVNPLFEENDKDVEIKSSSFTLTSPEESEFEAYLEKDSIPPGIDLTLPPTLEVSSSNPTSPTLTGEKIPTRLSLRSCGLLLLESLGNGKKDSTRIEPTISEASRVRYVVPTGRVIATVSIKVPTGSSNAKFPYLKKDEYETWAMKMEYWIMNSDHNLWNIVLHGNSRKRTGRDPPPPPRGNIMILPPVTMEEQIAVQRETKARTILLQSLPEDHMADFHHLDDAKDIWLAVKARFRGNEESKKMRKFQKVLSQLNQIEARPDNEDCNMKFLRALPPSCYTTTSSSADASGNVLENVLHSFVAEEMQCFLFESIDLEKKAGSKFKFITKMLPGLKINKVRCYSISELGTFCKENVQGKKVGFKESEDMEKGASEVYGMIAGYGDDAVIPAVDAADGVSTDGIFADGVFVATGNGFDGVSVADGVSVTSSDATDAETQFALMGLSPQAKIDNMNNKVKLEESEARSDEVFDLSAPSIFDSCLKDALEKPLYNSVKSSSLKTKDQLALASSSVDLKNLHMTDDQGPCNVTQSPSFSFKENVIEFGLGGVGLPSWHLCGWER
ncbi:reverse transcriptase domain-containing protein [Tanacetum coccineum]